MDSVSGFGSDRTGGLLVEKRFVPHDSRDFFSKLGMNLDVVLAKLLGGGVALGVWEKSVLICIMISFQLRISCVHGRSLREGRKRNMT